MRGMDTYEIIKEQIVSASGLAALVSSFGDSLHALAIPLSVYELSGSLAGVGYAMMGFGLLGLVYMVSLLAAACGKGQLRREVSSGEER